MSMEHTSKQLPQVGTPQHTTQPSAHHKTLIKNIKQQAIQTKILNTQNSQQ